MSSDHVELGWGLPVEYEFFCRKVRFRIGNERTKANRNNLTGRANKKRKTSAPKSASAAAAAAADSPPTGHANKKRKTGAPKGNSAGQPSASTRVRHTAHDTARKDEIDSYFALSV